MVATNDSGRQHRHLVQEIVRFLAVGGVATLVSVLGFNVLVHGALIAAAPLHDKPITAFVVVNVIAGGVAYVGMRLWAFNHRQVQRPVSSVFWFFTLGALTMAIPVLCLAVSRYVLGLSDPWSDNISANVIGLGAGTATRFWVFRRYVFTEVPDRPIPAFDD